MSLLSRPADLASAAHPASAHPQPWLFSLDQVDLWFGAHAALRGIDLRVHRGERVALIGANGCGKSTLLRVLHGLLEPTHGQRRQVQPLRQAMLFQRPHMLRTPVWRHVALALWLVSRVLASPFGSVIEAIRENEKRTAACGYDVDRAKLLVFVISAGICGLAGSLRPCTCRWCRWIRCTICSRVRR